CRGVGEVDWWWHLRISGGEWRVVFLGMFCIGEDSFDERSMKSVLGTFLGGFWVEELTLDAMEMMIKKRGIVRARVVSRVVFLGMFWIGKDSFDERSMKSVLGTFLGGFWVEELTLDAMEMMIKKRF
nr:hypothetical protein [Tanacetum cinerariifolium]